MRPGETQVSAAGGAERGAERAEATAGRAEPMGRVEPTEGRGRRGHGGEDGARGEGGGGWEGGASEAGGTGAVHRAVLALLSR